MALSHGAPKHILTKALERNEDKNESVCQALTRSLRSSDIQTVQLYTSIKHSYRIPDSELEKCCKILMQENNKEITNRILDHFDRENYIQPNIWQIIFNLGIEYDCAKETLSKIDEMCQKRNIPISGIYDFYTSVQHRYHFNEHEILKPWTSFKQIQKTNITEPLDPHVQSEDVLQIIKDLLNNNPGNDESDSVTREIKILLGVLVHMLKNSGVLWECIPTLVGSGREKTRCIPDEYDYVLKFVKMVNYLDVSYNRINHEGKVTIKSILPNRYRKELESLEEKNMIDNERFYDTLLCKLNSDKKAVLEDCHDQGINIVDIMYKKGRSFLFMTITRRDDPFKINVDLVPAFPFKDNVELPNHSSDIGTIDQHFMTLKSEFAKSKYNVSFSEIELKLIKQLPNTVKMAYKLAKALRNCYIVKRVIPKLIDLGIAYDLEDLISSYMLKTCLLWISRDGVKDHDNSLDYCIDIYKQLQVFVEQGEILNFFLRGVEGITWPRTLFVCHRQKRDTRLACCRRKEAILLVVKEILSEIQSHSKQFRKDPPHNPYHPQVIESPTQKRQKRKMLRQSNEDERDKDRTTPSGSSNDVSINTGQNKALSYGKLQTRASKTKRTGNKPDITIEMASLSSSDEPIVNENTTML